MTDALSDLFILRGVPGHIRSNNGPEFIAKFVQAWITGVGARTAYIAPGSECDPDRRKLEARIELFGEADLEDPGGAVTRRVARVHVYNPSYMAG